MRRILLCLTLAICLASRAFAGGPAPIPQSSLPSSFAGWTGGSLKGISAPSLQGWDALAPILSEYGFTNGEQRQYDRSRDSLLVRLYRMKDPSGAYGLYSFLRTPDMEKSDLSKHSSLSPEDCLVLLGNLILEISGKNLHSLTPNLKELVAQVAPRAVHGPYPLLWQHLPRHGLEPRSDHYLLGPAALNHLLPLASGDWLGFSEGAEAELARYRIHGQQLTLLIVDFPTPQMASRKLAELERTFNINGAGSSAGPTVLYAQRHLTLLSIVVNARSQEVADILLSQIHSGTEVTWNEPSFSLTDPNIGTVIVGIIVGTGILCMFALIAGLAFGGVRLAVKRLLPGKVFDRRSQMQILQLGLSSKPIDAEDFYGLGTTPRG